jgi:thiol-disulfide isomerase/thioredoxin
MRCTTTALLLLTLAGTPAALSQAQDRAPQAQPETATELDHDEAAVEILRNVAEAVSKGYLAEVRCYAEGAPMLVSTFPKSEGRWAQMAVNEDASEWAVRYTGQGSVMTRNQPVDFDVLWQADRVTWIDHENEVFNVQRSQGRKKGESYQLASSAFGQAADFARGFADALAKAATIELASPMEIEGTLCDAVAIREKAEGDAVLWYFGREDKLPRRSEIVLPDNELISGSIRVDFIDGIAGADAVTPSDFKIFAPDGYQQDIASIFMNPEERAALNTPLPNPVNAGPPTWQVNDSEGNAVSPADLTGKVSVLYFWGTWSPACDKASPELAKLAEEFADQPVEFLGMAFREGEPDKVADAARAQGQTWRVFPEADDAVKLMGIRNAPSFVVLGPQSELLFRSGRPRGDNYGELVGQLRSVITRALTEDNGDDDRSSDAAQSGTPGTRVAPATATKIRKPVIVKKKDE